MQASWRINSMAWDLLFKVRFSLISNIYSTLALIHTILLHISNGNKDIRKLKCTHHQQSTRPLSEWLEVTAVHLLTKFLTSKCYVWVFPCNTKKFQYHLQDIISCNIQAVFRVHLHWKQSAWMSLEGQQEQGQTTESLSGLSSWHFQVVWWHSSQWSFQMNIFSPS